ncbi:hypothetical protein FRB95_009960 [Tulasnella sp. JGI-2019a]|nr:hypothetical protein FRB95_009960 [Tulasnella sp. JGI-2019a]
MSHGVSPTAHQIKASRNGRTLSSRMTVCFVAREAKSLTGPFDSLRQTQFPFSLIYHLKAPILFPYVENIEDVLELLPYSNRNGSTSSRFYTCQEIVKMAATVEDGRNGMVVKRYEASKAQRKAEVALILQSGKKCLAWSLERSARKARQKADEELRVRVERERMITQKLKEAGHDDRDIDSIVYHPLVVKAVKITDARESLPPNLSSLVPNMDISFKPEEWVELSPKLTKLVMKEKERRLDRERRILVTERRKVFVTVIKDFQESNGLWECSFAPSLTEILATPPFWDVVEQTGDANITAEDFDGAIAAFPDWIEKWKTSKMMELLKIMANGGGPPLPNTPSNADFIVFNLAKTFFRCKRSIGIGKMHTLGNMDRHACIHRVHFPGAGDREITDWAFGCLVYNADASRMVEKLITAAGLNPDTTTAEDMDRLDA